jgi:hypothetical protein
VYNARNDENNGTLWRSLHWCGRIFTIGGVIAISRYTSPYQQIFPLRCYTTSKNSAAPQMTRK